MEHAYFSVRITPNWEGLVDCIERKGTPDRVHHIELFLDDFDMPLDKLSVGDTAGYKRAGGREFINQKKGPISTWEEFEQYPWPDPAMCRTTQLEWYEKNLPDDMCVVGSGGFAHFAEFLSWLMGYETLCYALYEDRDLVDAIRRKLVEIYEVVIRRLLEFERVKIIWGSDDMGFRGGPLISPDDLGEYVFPGRFDLFCCNQIFSGEK